MSLPGSWGRAVEALGRGARRLVGLAPSAAHDRQLGASLLAGGALLPLAPRLAPLLAAVAWTAQWARARARLRLARRHLVLDLAEAVPLFQLAVAGGLTVRAALEVVVPWLEGPLGRGLGAALDPVGAAPLADGLDRLADALGPAARPLLTALAAADRYGAPLDGPLAQLALDTRLAARRLAEEDARRVPVRLLFPLVAGVLPAFVLLTVVPLLVSSLRAVQVTAP